MKCHLKIVNNKLEEQRPIAGNSDHGARGIGSGRPRSWCSTPTTKPFLFYGGVCRRGIYDNMKTAVEAIFVGKAQRAVAAGLLASVSGAEVAFSAVPYRRLFDVLIASDDRALREHALALSSRFAV